MEEFIDKKIKQEMENMNSENDEMENYSSNESNGNTENESNENNIENSNENEEIDDEQQIQMIINRIEQHPYYINNYYTEFHKFNLKNEMDRNEIAYQLDRIDDNKLNKYNYNYNNINENENEHNENDFWDNLDLSLMQ